MHDCPNSPFNKAKQLQRTNHNDVTRSINCKYCRQQITFNDNITSRKGRKIPLNIDGSNHNCPIIRSNKHEEETVTKPRGPVF